MDNEDEVKKITEELGFDSESIVVSKDGRFVPLDEEVGDSEEIEIHKVIAGG